MDIEQMKKDLGGGNVFPIGEENVAFAKYFTGECYLNMLTTERVPVGLVTFAPGTINAYHIHHKGGQILMVTGGRGWYQEEGKPARSLELNEDEQILMKGYNLLTAKPMIYVANLDDEGIMDPDSCAYYNQVKEYAQSQNNQVVALCAQMEEELSGLDKEEKDAFLEELGVETSGLDQLIQKAYAVLDLCTFLTAGEDECRAWTFKKGMKAPDCAGVIHTDFKKGFIRAEVYRFEDIDELGSELAIKEAGRLRLEGKDYVVQDGDVMHFRFNV